MTTSLVAVGGFKWLEKAGARAGGASEAESGTSTLLLAATLSPVASCPFVYSTKVPLAFVNPCDTG